MGEEVQWKRERSRHLEYRKHKQNTKDTETEVQNTQ